VQLQQGFAFGEMGFTDKFALQKSLNGPCPLWVLAFLKFGRALASRPTDAAVLGTFALYARQVHARLRAPHLC